MTDPASDTEGAPTEESEEYEFDHLSGVVSDGLVGAVGGFVGTVLMTGVLLAAESVGAFSRGSFAWFAGFVDVLGAAGGSTAVGYVLFLGVGMFLWPLLFASLKAYLPGGRDPARGVAFGTALWAGFAVAFYDGETVVAYLTLTLLAHWSYGVGLGAAFEYMTTRPEHLV